VPDVVVVSGTTTGVGKTWLAAALARALVLRSVPVHVRKAVQSFDPSEGETDAKILAAAAGAPAEVVCPPSLSFPVPLAPPIAAQVLGRPLPRLCDVLAALARPPEGILLVEGVGGPRSPLASDADTVRLAEALDAGAVVIAADPALGAISLVTMSVDAFGGRPASVFLNRFDPRDEVHATNRAWLAEHLRARVHTEVAALADDLVDRPAEVA
jgi:dethiobiotin synthetase